MANNNGGVTLRLDSNEIDLLLIIADFMEAHQHDPGKMEDFEGMRTLLATELDKSTERTQMIGRRLLELPAAGLTADQREYPAWLTVMAGRRREGLEFLESQFAERLAC